MAESDCAEDPEELLRRDPELDSRLRSFFAEIDDVLPETPASSPASERATLGDFRILHEIGSGGMATVYEAEQLSLRRRVALKVLSPHLSFSERSVSRFQREAQAGGRLSHPGIVSTFAVGEQSGAYFIAQELVVGGCTLADLLRKRRSEGAPTQGHFRAMAALVAEVADALAYAHAHNVIHRDVKPSNILLGREARPLVSDFGLARVDDALALSRSGEFIGTPYYMSPEQARRKRSEVDSRTDVYSLGATLYEILTLRVPFPDDSSDEVTRKILNLEPRDPQKIDPRVPKDLAVVCLKAMEKDSGRRYQTMVEFADDLRRFHSGEAVRARPVSPWRRAARWVGRHKLPSVAALASLVALAAWGVVGLQVARRERTELRSAVERYQHVRDILGSTDYRLNPHLADTCEVYDAGDPSGHIFHALHNLQGLAWSQAAQRLERCIEACRARGERDLERDAHYLLGLTAIELAGDSDGAEEAYWRDRAERAIVASGGFDPVSRRDLVWRRVGPEGVALLDGSSNIHDLKLDSEHYLVPLYNGMAIWDHLYKGGDWEAFEKAIELFDEVLAVRPDHGIPLTLQGRTLYFFARTYDVLPVLDRAEELLSRAIADAAWEQPHHLAHATLGQLLLLRGDPGAAIPILEQGCALVAESDRYGHNLYKALGQAHTRLGRPELARQWIEEALGQTRRLDPGVNVAMVDLLLPLDPNAALHYAKTARGPGEPWDGPQAPRSRMALGILACARVHVELGEVSLALENLGLLEDQGIPDPRAFSLACQLLATLPEEELGGESEVASMRSLARRLGTYLENVSYSLRDPGSPICSSGRGAARLVEGRYAEAIADLERALEVRGAWPAELRRNHWYESATDSYLLAIAHEFATPDVPGDQASRTAFERAEALHREHGPPSVLPRLHERVRARAREVLQAD